MHVGSWAPLSLLYKDRAILINRRGLSDVSLASLGEEVFFTKFEERFPPKNGKLDADKGDSCSRLQEPMVQYHVAGGDVMCAVLPLREGIDLTTFVHTRTETLSSRESSTHRRLYLLN